MSRFIKWFIIVALLVLVFMLLRRGAIAPASIIGGLILLATLVEKLLRIHYIRKAYNASGGNSNKQNMSVSEAREVLGVGPDATEQEIEQAYKALMKKNHPDQGGSKYFASQLNQAKEVLLKERKGK